MSSLYIHIPFCKNKCFYCDFPSYSCMENSIEEYLNALEKEAKLRAKDTYDTIFIGGGTPTYLNEKQIEKLGNIISDINIAKDYEFTMEANPGTLTKEKLSMMKDIGVNRLSMGLQSTNNELLKSIGRIHKYEEFLKNYNDARDVGFDNINADLMFGLPGQLVEDHKKSLESMINLGLDHISAYSLIIEEGTSFFDLYNNDKLKLPDEDAEREMYRITLEELKKAGYHQYEISNFSKENKECRHNIVYWTLNDYIGIGSSSASYCGHKRIKNVNNVDKYIELMNNNDNAIEEIIKNSTNDDMEEFVFMGLRMIKGISLDEFYKRYNKNIEEVYGDVIKKYLNMNLLNISNGNMFLTKKGIEVSNYIMSDFIL